MTWQVSVHLWAIVGCGSEPRYAKCASPYTLCFLPSPHSLPPSLRTPPLPIPSPTLPTPPLPLPLFHSYFLDLCDETEEAKPPEMLVVMTTANTSTSSSGVAATVTAVVSIVTSTTGLPSKVCPFSKSAVWCCASTLY